jgi:FAD/FMN-containing dehydrogenase
MEHARSSRWVFRKIKDIFDPDDILAPGRLALGGSHAA